MSTSSRRHANEQEIHKIMRTSKRLKKSHEYKQEMHKSQEESCVRAEDSQKWCRRAEDSQKLQNSWKRAEDSQKCVRAERLQTRSRVVRLNVMTHACNQLLRIQLTLTEFLLRRATKSQVVFIVHLYVHPCSWIVEQLVDVPVLQKSGTHCHWIISQTNLRNNGRSHA